MSLKDALRVPTDIMARVWRKYLSSWVVRDIIRLRSGQALLEANVDPPFEARVRNSDDCHKSDSSRLTSKADFENAVQVRADSENVTHVFA